MSAVRRSLSFRIDASERIGERLRVDGHIARTGIQIYRDGIDERREYRSPDEVFSADSLASMSGMPVTVQHPRGLVTPKTWKSVAVGHVGDDARRSDDGSHVAASLWVHEDRTIKRIDSGELVELSVGYLANLDMTPGTTPEGERYDARQMDIRGNHVALLQAGQARGGASVSLRLDSDGNEDWSVDDARQGDTEMKVKIKIDGVDYEVEATDNGLQVAVDRQATALEAEQARANGFEAKLDALTTEHDEAKATIATAAKADADRARTALIADAKRLGPDIVIADSFDETAIRRAALTAKGIATDGKTDAYVAVRFEIALDSIDAETEIEKSAAEKARVKLNTREDSVEITGAQRAATSIDAGIRYIERS